MNDLIDPESHRMLVRIRLMRMVSLDNRFGMLAGCAEAIVMGGIVDHWWFEFYG